MTHPPSLLQPKKDAMVRMTGFIFFGKFYALVLLHLLSSLALGTIQLDGGSPERGVLDPVKPQPAQSGFPADRTANSVHGQRAREEPRGIRICLWRGLGWILERHRLRPCGCGRGTTRRCGTKSERGRGVKECSWGLGEHERAMLREKLVETQVGSAQQWMRRQRCGGG